jgi:hypothetical protein
MQPSKIVYKSPYKTMKSNNLIAIKEKNVV